jgi:hypothetical protein
VVKELDTVARYGQVLGWELRYRKVLVEGTTDVDLLILAARLEKEATGTELLGLDLAIVPAGAGDRGGTQGVIRELICLRGYARTCLSRSGRPIYRFIGLFDNDKAGRQAIGAARNLDASILEYKDVFRVHPIMPTSGNLDPKTLQKSFERENGVYKGLDWELEDLVSQPFVQAFLANHPTAVTKTMPIGGKVHRDLTRDGKARLHQFVRQHAMREDLVAVIDLLKALRFYMCLPPIPIATKSDR